MLCCAVTQTLCLLEYVTQGSRQSAATSIRSKCYLASLRCSAWCTQLQSAVNQQSMDGQLHLHTQFPTRSAGQWQSLWTLTGLSPANRNPARSSFWFLLMIWLDCVLQVTSQSGSIELALPRRPNFKSPLINTLVMSQTLTMMSVSPVHSSVTITSSSQLAVDEC